MKKVYFIRHAETRALVSGVMAGSELDTQLTDKGRNQARKAGQFLRDKGIELIVLSPMKRTRETATIIAQELGLDDDRLLENKLIIERSFGKYSNRPAIEYIRDLKTGKLDESIESNESLHQRVVEFLDWLKARPETVILLVTHGATGRMIKLVSQNLPHSDFHKIKRFQPAELDEFTIE